MRGGEGTAEEQDTAPRHPALPEVLEDLGGEEGTSCVKAQDQCRPP